MRFRDWLAPELIPAVEVFGGHDDEPSAWTVPRASTVLDDLEVSQANRSPEEPCSRRHPRLLPPSLTSLVTSIQSVGYGSVWRWCPTRGPRGGYGTH